MAIDAFSDDELLQLKKRARRRLVGAVALMLVAMVILSVVVDKTPPEKKPAPENPVAIQGMKPEPAPVPSVPAQTLASAASEPRALPPLVPSRSAPKSAAPEPVVPPSVDRAPAAKPVQPPAVKPQAKPTPKVEKPPKLAAEKPPRAVEKILEDQPEDKPKPAAAARGHLMAQIAALSSEEKARGLQAKLASHGIPSTTETVTANGRTVVRVKIGPFDSAEALKKARARAAQMGL